MSPRDSGCSAASDATAPFLSIGPGALGHTINVSAPITINGPTTEDGNLSALLAEHARTIAREVQKVLAIEMEQSAVV